MAESPASERLTWAVDLLQVRPADRILEIGCGHGVAISRICGRLTRGKVTGLDRSGKMIDAATRRNAECIAAGKAELVLGSVESTEFAADAFDTIFAVNVGVLWGTGALPVLAAIRKWLKKSGELYLFVQAPPQMKRRGAAGMPAMLREAGYSVEAVVQEDLRTARALCVLAAKG